MQKETSTKCDKKKRHLGKEKKDNYHDANSKAILWSVAHKKEVLKKKLKITEHGAHYLILQGAQNLVVQYKAQSVLIQEGSS